MTYDETLGFVLDFPSRLMFSSAWGRRSSHLFIGKSVATPVMILNKFCLKDLMVTSDILCRWQYGGTILRAQCCHIRVFVIYEHSFSRMWHYGVILVYLILFRRIRYALCISVSVLFFIGATSVVLLFISTITMMYLYPCWEWKGKRPVWSEYFLCFV